MTLPATPRGLNPRFRRQRILDALDHEFAPAPPARWHASPEQQAALVATLAATLRPIGGVQPTPALLAPAAADGLTAGEPIPDGAREHRWTGARIVHRRWSEGCLPDGSPLLLGESREAATPDALLALLHHKIRAVFAAHAAAAQPRYPTRVRTGR